MRTARSLPYGGGIWTEMPLYRDPSSGQRQEVTSETPLWTDRRL